MRCNRGNVIVTGSAFPNEMLVLRLSSLTAPPKKAAMVLPFTITGKQSCRFLYNMNLSPLSFRGSFYEAFAADAFGTGRDF
jgi:hypothetical protein